MNRIHHYQYGPDRGETCDDLHQKFDPDYLCKIVYIYCWKCEGRGFVFLGTTTIADCLHCKGSHFEPLDAVDKKREHTCNSLYL